jgi:hypothetical protein
MIVGVGVGVVVVVVGVTALRLRKQRMDYGMINTSIARRVPVRSNVL